LRPMRPKPEIAILTAMCVLLLHPRCPPAALAHAAAGLAAGL
jgi:hypothetical protein